ISKNCPVQTGLAPSPFCPPVSPPLCDRMGADSVAPASGRPVKRFRRDVACYVSFACRCHPERRARSRRTMLLLSTVTCELSAVLHPCPVPRLHLYQRTHRILLRLHHRQRLPPITAQR